MPTLSATGSTSTKCRPRSSADELSGEHQQHIGSFRCRQRPATGYRSVEQMASDINRYRQESGLDEFQINCHDCGNLQRLLDTMEALVQDVFPKVDG
ncbi:MAG: hypothetical protein F4Y44_03485 [Chloroflexi bacterium]|nr:hypothetical protein [Chloroflexota bacterium]